MKFGKKCEKMPLKTKKKNKIQENYIKFYRKLQLIETVV